jgi:hypothetical protein
MRRAFERDGERAFAVAGSTPYIGGVQPQRGSVVHMTTVPLLAVAALVVGACESSTRTNVSSLAELAQREAVWQSQELHDYTFEYHYEFGGVRQAARITVQADTVASVVDLATDSTVALELGSMGD